MKRYNLINNLLGWACFVVSAVTYLLTLEPTASFWDCPEFISQGAKLEVGHPPGNPIFMLTARFFVTITGNDISNAAIAVNAMSALLSAATILLLFWTITHLARKILVRDDATAISLPKMLVIMGAGLCGALAYTWSDTFWFSAVEGEVYAFSSFCTALVFWLILKWENRADEPHSDRYLVLIAYVIGVSIAVHLLNLLCIPAIVLVFYYRKWKHATAKGSLLALLVSFVFVAAILYGLVPGFIKVAQGFELFFVNTVGLGYNMGVLIYAIALLAVAVWAIHSLYAQRSPVMIKLSMAALAVMSGLTFITDSKLVWALLVAALLFYLFVRCKRVPVRVFNVVALSILVIFVGYSSYALLLIRATAYTPMNQNAPDNVFALSSYLNREQYGQRPLFMGPAFAEQLDTREAYDNDGNIIKYVTIDEDGVLPTKPIDQIYRDAEGNAIDNGKGNYSKVAKTDPSQPDKYVKESWTPDYKTVPDLDMLFTRIYSSDAEHVKGYKSWSGYTNPDLYDLSSRVPMQLMQRWIQQGYVPAYELGPFLSHDQEIATREGGAEAVSGWKASMADNIRYFLNYQLNHMYWRYFMWNFAGRQNDIQGNGEPNLGNWISGIPFIDNARLGDQSLLPAEYTTANKGHNVFYMLPLLLGLLGIIWQALMTHKANPDRGIEQFWVVFFLFFMTGIAIVLYLNQTPGQPRERDYAFAGSFYAFTIWVGLGVPAVWRLLCDLFTAIKGKKATDKKEATDADYAHDKMVSMSAAVTACVIGLLVPLQMVSQTWDDHDRSHRYTARDFGFNYLHSLAPNAIIFTNGDNDTFPLWYAQEVEGVRTDVRVVNLSYLSTDWYANQMHHPFYDAEAVPMLAKPTDYAYDQLAYSYVDPYLPKSQPAADSASVVLGITANHPINAIEGLTQFYASEPSDIFSTPVHLLSTPYMYAPVDKEKAIKAFGLNPQSADSIAAIPYIQDVQMSGALNGGFGLSKLLSFDIVANSIADGFERPVYFASTVPGRYYLGLEPYMHSTGVAQQVTPFRGAPASPLAPTAYENIMSKFRWGGLDDPEHNQGLYLDETVRRMVSTMRNTLIEVAEELCAAGELPASDFAVQWAQEHGEEVPVTRYDMARRLLHLMEEKMPQSVTPYESMTDITTIARYLSLYAATGNADDLARAEALIDVALPRYSAFMRYASTLTNGTYSQLSPSDRYTLQYVPLLIGYKNYIDLSRKLEGTDLATPEQINLLAKALNYNDGIYAYNFAFLQPDATPEELDEYAGTSWGLIPSEAATIMRLSQAVGIDPATYVDELVTPYGINRAIVARFNSLYAD